jgi:hypothetical protein
MAVPQRRGNSAYWYPTPIAEVRREQCPIVRGNKRFSVIHDPLVKLEFGEINNPIQFDVVTI